MPATICGIVLHPQPEKQSKNTPFTESDLRWIVGHLKSSALEVQPFNWDLRRIITRLAGAKMLRTGKLPEGGKDRSLDVIAARWMACAAIAETAGHLVNRESSRPTMIVAAAADFLRKHYQEQVTMPDLVKRLGFGRARMFQLFKEGMGLTPNDYLQRIRVEKAQEFLSTSQKSITEIALETGFNSSQYFSTVFRRYTGQTPTLYRERFSP
jgi:YesN/AraC family two-component response regulator